MGVIEDDEAYRYECDRCGREGDMRRMKRLVALIPGASLKALFMCGRKALECRVVCSGCLVGIKEEKYARSLVPRVDLEAGERKDHLLRDEG